MYWFDGVELIGEEHGFEVVNLLDFIDFIFVGDVLEKLGGLEDEFVGVDFDEEGEDDKYDKHYGA